MASSSTSICNSALIKLGLEKIDSLSDDTRRAIYCNEQYAKMRDEVLISHPWNFAIARKEFSATVNTPLFDYDTEFTIPSDCLRVLDIYGQPEWEVAINAAGDARVLLANQSEVKVKYIKQVTDTTLFTPSFDETLAARLAAEMAYALVQKRSVQEDMWNLYKMLLADARSFDAQEKSRRMIEADDWLNERF